MLLKFGKDHYIVKDKITYLAHDHEKDVIKVGLVDMTTVFIEKPDAEDMIDYEKIIEVFKHEFV